MEVKIKGQLIDVKQTEPKANKQGILTVYYSLVVYDGYKNQYIGVSEELFNKYKQLVGKEVELFSSIYVKGQYSLYIK